MSLFRKNTIKKEKSTSLQSLSSSRVSAESLNRKSLDNTDNSKYKSIRSSFMSFMSNNSYKEEPTPPPKQIPLTTREDLRKRATERYCLELVLFKEDFERLSVIPVVQKELIQTLTFEIWRNYFSKNSANEINIPARLSDKFRRSILNDEYDRSILDEIYKEVMRMLLENEISEQP